MIVVKKTMTKKVDLKNLTYTGDGIVDEDGCEVDIMSLIENVFDVDSCISINISETNKDEYEVAIGE